MRAAGPRVVIAGGSLGGLTAALWLRDAGCEVHVYERSPVPLEGQGAGIVLNPATIRWFVEREGRDPVDIGVGARVLRYLDGEGQVAAELPHPYRFSSYDSLYRDMIGAFGRERYHLGEEVVGVEQDADEASAELASGDAVGCEMVVWADGIRSTGRRQHVPAAERSYAGYVGWRGTVSLQELSDATFGALDNAITYCVLPHGHVLTYVIPAGDARILNWLWYRNVSAGEAFEALMTDRAGSRREVAVPPGLVNEDSLAELRAAARAELPPPLAEVVERTLQPYLQAIFDIDIERMAFGRACLIGDAACAARPHAAAGSAKAAEDGYRLGVAVREAGGDVVAALRSWEPAQLELAHRVLERTRDAGHRSQFAGTWRAGDPLPFGLYEVGDSIMATA